MFQPMSMVRGSFRDRREGYTDKAVVIRFLLFLTSCCIVTGNYSWFLFDIVKKCVVFWELILVSKGFVGHCLK